MLFTHFSHLQFQYHLFLYNLDLLNKDKYRNENEVVKINYRSYLVSTMGRLTKKKAKQLILKKINLLKTLDNIFDIFLFQILLFFFFSSAMPGNTISLMKFLKLPWLRKKIIIFSRKMFFFYTKPWKCAYSNLNMSSIGFIQEEIIIQNQDKSTAIFCRQVAVSDLDMCCNFYLMKSRKNITQQ